MDDIK